MAKSPEMKRLLDKISQQVYGRKRSECLESATCTSCGSEVKEFRDSLSRKDYGLSGFCQKCQDETFGV
jgi:hypothetical protein